MQTVIFVRRTHGVSRKGVDYDLVEVSDGLQTMTLSLDPAAREGIENIEKAEKIDIEVHVEAGYGGLRGTIVQWQVNTD